MTAALATNTYLDLGAIQEYVTVMVDSYMFGIPVLKVHDILGPQRITKVPLAPPEVLGQLNLRGRIVTALSLRILLGLPRPNEGAKEMNVVVEFGNDLYSLIVDQVGEVMSLSQQDYERNPATLEARWRNISNGIYRLEDRLMVVLDVDKLVKLSDSETT